MSHDEAKVLASAHADGELHDDRARDAMRGHLASCDSCAAFAANIARLGTLARFLEDPALPAGFARLAPVRPPVRARRAVRRRPRVAAVLAAAAVTLTLVVAGLPVRTFRVAPASAAEALLDIRSIDAVREVVQEDADGRATMTTRERIRYRAPASTRIDRTITEPGEPEIAETEIRVPGTQTLIREGRTVTRTNLAPSGDAVPEPLSPTLALVGHDAGPGPVVAGRATRRVELAGDDGRVRREALVDAARSTLRSASVSVVLQKANLTFGSRTVKRVTSIRYNVRLDDALFDIPAGPSLDGGFHPVPEPFVVPRPRVRPDGFDVVAAGRDDAGTTSILYARGAFTILVAVGPDVEPDDDTILDLPARVGSRPARLLVGLYALPALRFQSETADGTRTVTIASPMTREQLERIALQMFPE